MEGLKNKKIVFHIHTKYSPDSLLKPKKIVDFLYKNGVNCAVITDHNSIEGAKEAKEYAKEKYGNDFVVIVGEEIKSSSGDIIGFPIKNIITHKNLYKIIKEIKKQKGFVVIPHPYKDHKIKDIIKVRKNIDFIETFNSRIEEKLNQRAKILAKKYGLKEIIGSDAHLKSELLNAIFKFSENYEIEIIKKSNSNIRAIRASQIIKNVKENEFKKLIKHAVAYILGL